jgi:hypothetical protein
LHSIIVIVIAASGALLLSFQDEFESDDSHAVYMFLCNCTLINDNLTNYYKQFNSSAYVDTIEFREYNDTVQIKVLFAPWTANIIGTGEISSELWGTLCSSIVDNGILVMNQTANHPDDFNDAWPFDLYLQIYYDDLTFQHIGYGKSNGLIAITSGTWTGQYYTHGVPIKEEWNSKTTWLVEDGFFRNAMSNLYNIVTANVQYP